jgi:hypothetical protein
MTETHDMVRTGQALDIYYYDSETSKKQAFPTTFNTKYIQAFQNLTGGSSVFTIPPQNGITDIVCSFVFAGPSTTPGAVALPRGWGYALINRVSYRYGGSSQYFLTGAQILQNALRSQPNRTACNDILTLGGNYATGSDLIGNQYANIVLTLPHNMPSGVGKQHPFPTDLLTQQVQITIELNPPSSIFTNQLNTTLPSWCQALSSAQFQVAQIMMNNQGDCLARRVDMSVNAYAYPAEFVQQQVSLPLGSMAGTPGDVNSTSVALVATGFRAGEVKSLQMWLTRASDTATPASTSYANNPGYNPFNWRLPLSIEVLYAGEIYSRFQQGSSALWNLINGDKTPAVDSVVISGSGGAITASGTAGDPPVLSEWVEAPFAQPLVDEDSHYILTHGKPLTNGLLNINVVPPQVQNDWVLNISYCYNTTLLFSQGTCDFVF